MFPPKPRPLPWTGRASFPCYPRKIAFLLGADVTAHRVTYWELGVPQPNVRQPIPLQA